MRHRQSGPAGRVSLIILPIAAALGLTATGCGSAASGPLRVAAASDLQRAMPVLTRQYRERTGVATVATFGASGQLAEQIKAGAPFDLFLAANLKFVQDLADDGLVRPGSVAPYARGTLVLAVHRESGTAIEGLADLTRPGVRKVSLANPAFAPYGAAGKQAIERAGLWPDVGPKIVQAESVRQALQYVQSGNAEAGLVGRAIADVPEVRVIDVDPRLYDPIVQGLGIVSRSRSGDVEAFRDFVLGPEGRRILADFGLKAP